MIRIWFASSFFQRVYGGCKYAKAK